MPPGTNRPKVATGMPNETFRPTAPFTTRSGRAARHGVGVTAPRAHITARPPHKVQSHAPHRRVAPGKERSMPREVHLDKGVNVEQEPQREHEGDPDHKGDNRSKPSSTTKAARRMT